MTFAGLDELCEHFQTSHQEYHENIQRYVFTFDNYQAKKNPIVCNKPIVAGLVTL
jgi:predicted DNA-binding protein YlxM (UPF0122 family)